MPGTLLGSRFVEVQQRRARLIADVEQPPETPAPGKGPTAIDQCIDIGQSLTLLDASGGLESLMCANVNFRCPRCRRGGLRRWRPRWYDGIRIGLSRSKPYRCVDCHTRRWWRCDQVWPQQQ